jgi:hypothetical protein
VQALDARLTASLGVSLRRRCRALAPGAGALDTARPACSPPALSLVSASRLAATRRNLPCMPALLPHLRSIMQGFIASAAYCHCFIRWPVASTLAGWKVFCYDRPAYTVFRVNTTRKYRADRVRWIDDAALHARAAPSARRTSLCGGARLWQGAFESQTLARKRRITPLPLLRLHEAAACWPPAAAVDSNTATRTPRATATPQEQMRLHSCMCEQLSSELPGCG